LIQSGRMGGAQPLGLGLNGLRLADRPLGAGTALAEDAHRRTKPEIAERHPDHDEERDLRNDGDGIRRDVRHGLGSDRPSYPTRRRDSRDGKNDRAAYLASSEWAATAPSPVRSSLLRKAIFRSFSVLPASVPLIVHWPSKTTPSWITRLGVAMLPKTFPGALISSRLRAVMSPCTLPCTMTAVPWIWAFTSAVSPIVRVSCALISPSTRPSIRTVPSKTSFPLTRLPLPRNALVPAPSTSGWP